MSSSRHDQPQIRYQSDTSIFAILGAMGVGAALMYFLDPDSGKRRRVALGEKIAQGKLAVQDATETAVHNAAETTRGAIARIQTRIASEPDQQPINDPVSTGPTVN